MFFVQVSAAHLAEERGHSESLPGTAVQCAWTGRCKTRKKGFLIGVWHPGRTRQSAWILHSKAKSPTFGWMGWRKVSPPCKPIFTGTLELRLFAWAPPCLPHRPFPSHGPRFRWHHCLKLFKQWRLVYCTSEDRPRLQPSSLSSPLLNGLNRPVLGLFIV